MGLSSPGFHPFVDSTALLGAPARLAARYDSDGYLFLPGLIQPARTAALCSLVRATLTELGCLDEQGLTRPTPDYDDPDYIQLQRVVYPSPPMDALRRHPALQAVVRALLGGEPTMGRGDIVRVRGTGARTRPHQDRHYFDGDSPLVAAWMPLERCPLERGPLAILPRSHRAGLLPHSGLRRSEEGVDPVPEGSWATADLEPGDVVLFGVYTLHQGLPTRTRDCRLSADFRFGPPAP